MNEALVREVAAKIRQFDRAGVAQDNWSQVSYVSECGTTHCFAGWAMRLSGYGVRTMNYPWGTYSVMVRPGGAAGLVVISAEEFEENGIDYTGTVSGEFQEAQGLLGFTREQAEQVFYLNARRGEERWSVDAFLARVGKILELEGL